MRCTTVHKTPSWRSNSYPRHAVETYCADGNTTACNLSALAQLSESQHWVSSCLRGARCTRVVLVALSYTMLPACDFPRGIFGLRLPGPSAASGCGAPRTGRRPAHDVRLFTACYDQQVELRSVESFCTHRHTHSLVSKL